VKPENQTSGGVRRVTGLVGTRLRFVDLASAEAAARSFDWQAHVEQSRVATRQAADDRRSPKGRSRRVTKPSPAAGRDTP
jgi:hypothetical protein